MPLALMSDASVGHMYTHEAHHDVELPARGGQLVSNTMQTWINTFLDCFNWWRSLQIFMRTCLDAAAWRH